MMVLNLLFGLGAMFMLLGVSAWLWLRDPAWPWAQSPRPKLQPAHEAEPGVSPVLGPPSGRDDEAIDRTRIEAVSFPEASPEAETVAEPERTQILPSQLGPQSALEQPAHMRLNTLKLVEESSALPARRSS